ncbi:solute carrier family 45 member 3-like isoform X3 [Paramormyrops kingsleyae]|uniref:solute carrier family 45 member 3-like isoform X3 n=1 Tax=Paramormyrops kingsleyae TaxID=1676925 RepID=UPI003B96EB23
MKTTRLSVKPGIPMPNFCFVLPAFSLITSPGDESLALSGAHRSYGKRQQVGARGCGGRSCKDLSPLSGSGPAWPGKNEASTVSATAVTPRPPPRILTSCPSVGPGCPVFGTRGRKWGQLSLTKMSGWRSHWHLVLLNSLTCGLEICVAAGITHVPPLLLEAGVQERYMTMVLGIGPVLGLLFIPLIGSASDRCSSRFGRRRPFIWLLSLGVLLSLLIIPHADALAAHFGHGGRPLQVGLLILGVGLLDFCGQVCFTPLEALLSDLYAEEEACGQAFSMFSFMVSLGGCVGYLLPALDWSGGVLSDYLGGQEESLFAVLILIFILSVLVTMKVSVEEPPTRHAAVEPGPPEAVHCTALPLSCWPPGHCWSRAPRVSPLLCLLRACRSVTPAVYRGYCDVPQVMRRLCAAQLCGWMAVMSFVLFYTDFVGEGLYEGVPSAAPGTPSRQRYEEGIRMGSLGLFLQCATSTIFSLAMSRLVCRFGSRRIYLSSLASFTASALVICLSKSVALVTAMSALTGFAYATLQTLPYTLTCHYHKEAEVSPAPWPHPPARPLSRSTF